MIDFVTGKTYFQERFDVSINFKKNKENVTSSKILDIDQNEFEDKLNILIDIYKCKNPSIGKIVGHYHNIELTTNNPIICREYIVPLAERAKLQEHIRDLEEKE
ncbi:hypothetical protein M153_1354000311, partial [Pseudoloma neurophilia]